MLFFRANHVRRCMSVSKKCHRLSIIFFVILVISLAAYTLIAFLPHGHNSRGTDCAVCNMVEFHRGILLGIALFAIVRLLPEFVRILSVTCEHILSYRDTTPVGLKVKLSN